MEARSIAILAVEIILASAKARRVMKIDIVNPMPPNKPAPKIVFHFKSAGRVQIPALTPRTEKRTIPRGLPTTKPKKIPRLIGWNKLAPMVVENERQVFAKAKRGRMKKATGACKESCKIYEGDFLPPLPKGIAKAKSTPVIVA